MQSRPASTFTTPALVSDQLVKAYTGADEAIADEFNDYYALVQQYCFDMSKIIESEVHATYVPYYAAKTIYFAEAIRDNRFRYDVIGGHYVLILDDDMLAVDTLTYMTTELTASQYRLVDDEGSANGYPYHSIYFNPSGDLPGYNLGFTDAIEIEGEWGTQDNASDAYSTITTTAGALNASQTTINLTNGDGALFNVYDYIRVDDELMLITAINSSGDPDVLTVTRGVNGFTAATHDSGATITRWNVPHDIRFLTTRMVAYWYNKRSDTGERVQVINQSLVIAQFSEEIAAIAERRARHAYGVP